MNNDKSIAVRQDDRFQFSPALEHLAESISKSTIIPAEFRGNSANCLIALELAYRIGAGVLATMQSLYIVHGKPSWSGQFIIGAVNNTHRFTPLRFQFNSDKTECYAFATDLDGNTAIGPTVSIEMAKKEGWWQRNDKWKNMPELMLMYRSGTFFGRVFCPDILLGMREQYEVMEAQALEIKEPKIQKISDGRNAHSIREEQQASLESASSKPLAEPEPAPVIKAPVRKKSKLKVKERGPFDEPPKRPNQEALVAKVEAAGFTRGDFLAVCDRNGWLGKNKHWDSMDQVPDDMFAVFLVPDEWPAIIGELEAERQTTGDAR